MRMKSRVAFLIYSLWCLSLLTGCDRIFKRQVIIDFQNYRPNSFTVSEPGDVHNFFSRIEGIAQRDGLGCRPYDDAKKRYVCSHETVTLITYVTGEKAVTIELVQFGPQSKTEEFMTLERDLSDFIKKEFAGQDVKMTDPLRQ
jgi:hypothetical protein